MVLESGLLQEREERYELTGPLPPLAIPATLHDSLMARLDRLATVKGLAQLGATLGREFSYDLLQAVSPWDEATLQRGLQQLVEAEFLYQQGLPPQATYLFKHALIQDAAYQSLLRSTRQQYHQRIAQVLEARFPEIVRDPARAAGPSLHRGGLDGAGHPLLAAGRPARHRALGHLEAIGHLTKGLELLKTLPDTPERAQQELDLQTRPRPGVDGHQGLCSPGGGSRPTPGRGSCVSRWGRPRSSSRCCGDSGGFMMCGRSSRRRGSSGSSSCSLAQRLQDPRSSWKPTRRWGMTLFWLGRVGPGPSAPGAGDGPLRPQQHHAHAFLYGQDPGVCCRRYCGRGPVAAWLSGPGPAAAATRRSPWPRSWRTPSAWRMP